MPPLRDTPDGSTMMSFGSLAWPLSLSLSLAEQQQQQPASNSVMIPIKEEEEEEPCDLSPFAPSSSQPSPSNTTTSSTFTRPARSSSNGSATSISTSTTRSARSNSNSILDCCPLPTTPLTTSSCPEIGSTDTTHTTAAIMTTTAATAALGETHNAQPRQQVEAAIKSQHASPVKAGAAKKPPTLEDIAARMKLDGGNKENNRSPDLTASPQAPARGRLGLAGRLNSQSSLSLPTQSTMAAEQAATSPASTPEMDSPPSDPKPLAFGEPPADGAIVERIPAHAAENRNRSQSPSKRLPSLVEIRERMSRKAAAAAAAASSSPNMSASVSGLCISLQAKPFVRPEAKEEEKKEAQREAPASPVKAVAPTPAANPSTPPPVTGHPLQHKWTLFFDSTSFNPSATGASRLGRATEPPQTGSSSSSSSTSASSYEATLKNLGAYRTVKTFMGVFSKLRRPSQLERNSNYHLFKDGIKPLWEDEANAKGGKWVLTLRNQHSALLDRSWMWLVLALIGEELDEDNDVTGAVVSTRAKGDRIALWLRSSDDVDLVNRMGEKLVDLLDVRNEPGIHLEFVINPMRAAAISQSKSAKFMSVSNPMSATSTSASASSASTSPAEGGGAGRSQPIGIFQPPSHRANQRGSLSAQGGGVATSPTRSHSSTLGFSASHSPTRGGSGGLGGGARLSTSPSRSNGLSTSPTKFGSDASPFSASSSRSSHSHSGSGFDSTFGAGIGGNGSLGAALRRGSEQGGAGLLSLSSSRSFGKLPGSATNCAAGNGSSAFSSLSSRNSFSAQGSGGGGAARNNGSPAPNSPLASPKRKNSLVTSASSSSSNAFASLNTNTNTITAAGGGTGGSKTSPHPRSPTKGSFFSGPGTALGA